MTWPPADAGGSDYARLPVKGKVGAFSKLIVPSICSIGDFTCDLRFHCVTGNIE